MAPPTYTDLVAQTAPWYVEHRGNGDYHPEHTLAAYFWSFLAVPLGKVPAVEISVQRTIDNQLLCMHDANGSRTTTDNFNVADRYWTALRNLHVVDYGAKVNGPAWKDQPIPLLAEVLEAIGNKCILVIEPKAADTITVNLIFALLDKYGIDPASVVWKSLRSVSVGGGGGAPSHASLAKARGHSTWIYYEAADTDAYIDVGAADSNVVMMGTPVESTDARITYMVGKGKPVMCWEVHRRSERTRLSGLGVVGMMCSNTRYVRDVQPSGTIYWDTGVRAPGEIPRVKDDWAGSGVTFESDGLGGWTGFVTLDRGTNPSLLLGSICEPPNLNAYTVTYDLKWGTLPSDLTTHADFIFAELDDRGYGHQLSTNAGGYHAVFRANGSVQLFKHTNGSTGGTQLGSTVSTTAPAAGDVVRLRVTVTSTNVKFARLDLTTGAVIGTEIDVANTDFRGGYMHIAKASSNSAPSFGNIRRT